MCSTLVDRSYFLDEWLLLMRMQVKRHPCTPIPVLHTHHGPLPPQVQPLPPHCLLDERFTCLTLMPAGNGQGSAGAGRGVAGEEEVDRRQGQEEEQRQGQQAGGGDGDSDCHGEAEAGMQRLVAHMASRWDAGAVPASRVRVQHDMCTDTDVSESSRVSIPTVSERV